MASCLARAVRVSLGVPLPRMLFMSVNMVAIARLICICEGNVRLVD